MGEKERRGVNGERRSPRENQREGWTDRERGIGERNMGEKERRGVSGGQEKTRVRGGPTEKERKGRKREGEKPPLWNNGPESKRGSLSHGRVGSDYHLLSVHGRLSFQETLYAFEIAFAVTLNLT